MEGDAIRHPDNILTPNAIGLLFGLCWLLFSLIYYLAVHLPPASNLLVNLGCVIVLVVAAAMRGEQWLYLRVFIGSFALAASLTTLQVSRDQIGLQPEFVLFLLVHLSVMALAIGLGGIAGARGEQADLDRPDMLVNALLYLLLAVSAFVMLSKGVRIVGFLEGVKTDGNLYRVPGLSGLQGLLTVFLLCCFGSLSRINKVIFIAAILAIAVADVKRGEIIRVMIFLTFYIFLLANHRIVSRKVLYAGLAVGVLSVIVFVIFGEVRQRLYSASFSISSILDSRVGNVAIDWIYGYIGINVAVLQEYFNIPADAPGYFGQLVRLAISADGSLASHAASINGFNAGTALSLFAGGGSIVPSPDFLVFCALVSLLPLLANLSGSLSLKAFVLLQIFGFVFGNQLVLPYYVVGFFAAAGYLIVRNRLSLSLPLPLLARRA